VIARIGRDDVHSVAAGELLARRVQHVAPAAAENDAGALVEEAPRRGLADAAAAAGDEDDLVLVTHEFRLPCMCRCTICRSNRNGSSR
jgi:hypothetical protein